MVAISSWFLPQCEQKVLAAHKERAVRDGRGGHAHISHFTGGQELELWAGFHHAHVSLLGGKVKPAVRSNRGGRVALAAQALLIKLFPRLRQVASQKA